MKLDIENERLRFQKQQAQAELVEDPLKLLAMKMNIKKSIQKAIDKYSKQESIIIKVLDIINNSENKDMFEQKD